MLVLILIIQYMTDIKHFARKIIIFSLIRNVDLGIVYLQMYFSVFCARTLKKKLVKIQVA